MDDPRPDLRDAIMLEYAGAVERIARRYSGIEAFEDLVQVGFLGLLNALSKFDASAGVKFSTYANYLIAGEVKHYLRDKSQTIRQPAWMQEMRHKVVKAANLLQQTYGRPATTREISERIGVPEGTVEDVFAAQELVRVASLDATVQQDEDGESDVEKLDAADFCPEQLSVEDRLLLEHAMSQLRDLEKQVLVAFHFDAMSQTEIANKLGISCNYVSHILRQSLAKLRKILNDEAEKDRLLKREMDVVDYDVMDHEVGAYTEEFFRARLQEEFHRAASTGDELGLVLIEFKGLDALRRFYGQASVSDFVTDAAQYIRDNVRRLDLVCRLGETRFGVILPACGANVALVRQRLLNKLGQWMEQRYAQNSPLRVELGFASYPQIGRTAADLLAAAAPNPVRESEAA